MLEIRTSGLMRGKSHRRSRLAMALVGAHLSWYYSDVPAYFLDSRLSAHTPRNARFPMAPLAFTKKAWDGAPGARGIYGVCRLSPDGGFQLAHTTNFLTIARNHDSDGNFTLPNSYGLIGGEMWKATLDQLGSGTDQELKALVGYTWAYGYYLGLKSEARLTSGATLAAPVPRAWMTLPKFTARQLSTYHTERISVRLALEAPEGGSLDLDRVVGGMNDAGQTAVRDSAVAPYNVRIDLPMDELAAGVSNDHVIMDFVEINTYGQATGLIPFATNAVIRAAACEIKKRPHGITVQLR